MKAKMILSAMKWGVFFGIAGVLILTGTPAQGQPPENWTCGIAYDIAPEAKITKVGWASQKTESGHMLVYEVGILNVSERPIRFKLSIFPLEGDPISVFYPDKKRKDKPLALEPKEEMVLKYPVFDNAMPKGFALVVKEWKD
jgi:hypothetical protein